MAIVGAPANRDWSEILDSADRGVYEVTTTADGPAGSLPLTDEMLREWPSGDLFGLTQNAGMGWTPAEVARDPYLILSTQGGLRGRWPGDRAGLSYGSLGDRDPGSGGGRGIEVPQRSPLCRNGVRPLRWPDAGDGRDDGQPPLSQRRGHRLPPIDPLAAASKGSAGDRDLRQGAPRHDDGAGGVEAAGRACWFPAA